jgi:secretion/DNA translocation related CpaE-like protein
VTGERRPLVVTADAELLDDVLGVAAAVGVAVDVAVEPGACRPQWTTAPLVLLGSDVAVDLGAAAARIRPGVVVVGRGGPGEDEIAATRAGADAVLHLPADEAVLAERLADVVEPPGGGRILGVLAGRGGAGASVFAAVTALAAAERGDPAWLVDLDPLGGGADAVLGAELAPGARWEDLDGLTGRVSGRALRAALPAAGGVAVLSCGRRSEDPEPSAVRAVLGAARRTGGTVAVDLPRHPGAPLDEVLTAADEVLLLVPGEVRAVLAARQLLSRLGRLPAPLRVVVRRTPEGLPPRQVAHGLGADLAGDYGDEPSVRAALVSGDPRGLVRHTDLGALCRRILDGSAALRAEAS